MLAKRFRRGTFPAGLMQPDKSPGHELGEGYKYVAMGIQFAGGIVMFLAGGWVLDRWLGLTPVLTVAGALVGAVLSFLSVYRRLQIELEERRAAKRDRRS